MTPKWIIMAAVFAALHVMQALPVRAVRPDPRLTPGTVGPASAQDVCRPGYAGRVRAVSELEKRQVFAAYGVVPERGERFEIDHLVPLELGGANDRRNLWPQPWAGPWTAGQKDRLENALHRDVCAGQEPLAQAQAEIRQDWIGAYQRYYGPKDYGPKGGMPDGG